VVLQEISYKEGELVGDAAYYNAKGELIIEGLYAANRKAGIWKYYEGDKLVKKMDYTNWNKPITTTY
jgi:antitoxin component YwqK of YwqJK toxin-antitoxin module